MMYLGLISILVLILGVSIYSSRKAKGKSFSGRGTATSALVMGALIGSFVGGSSTIGTTQAAFAGGFSAWWYTIGCLIGLLAFGLFFAKGIYESGYSTLTELIASRYGGASGVTMSLMSALGTLIGLVSQVLSGTALIETIVGINMLPAMLVFGFLVILYVFFGGGTSLGYMGIVKTILLLLGLGFCGIIAWVSIDKTALMELPPHYFNLFHGGVGKNLSKTVSLAAGIMTGQNYTSALITGKTYEDSRKAIYASAIFGPLIGLMCIFVGLFMKLNHPEMDPSLALPAFILEKTPGFIAGILEGAILITIVGTASAALYGTATTIYRGILKKRMKNETRVTRSLILIQLLGIIVFCMGSFGDLILNWSFLGVGLRGAAGLLPVGFALHYRKEIGAKWIIVSMAAAPAFTLIGKLFLSSIPLEPIFYGLTGSALFVLYGAYKAGKA